MPEEIKYQPIIEFLLRTNEASKKQVVTDAEEVYSKVDKIAKGKGKTTPISKPVEQTANAYDKLNQSIVSHNRIITELQKLEGGEQLAQKERLSIIREITQARAKGVIQEGQFSNELNKTSEAYTNVASASKKTLLSIAKWAVGWTVVYGVLRGVRSAVSSTVSDMLKLEQQIYRAVSASRFESGGGIPSGGQIGQLRDIYTRELLSLISESSINIQESGKALYYLSTAGLTAKEALSALPPVIDLTIAAFGNLEEISHLVASSYNVFNSQLTGFVSTQEKMQYITDVIAYSYRNQQVELSELSSAMQFSAQMAGVMDVEFKDLVGTIGFLSTGLLKGSKGGTSLFNAFIQIADKSDMLRDKLGILFDESKPLDFVNLMEQLHNRFGDAGMSLEDTNLLFDIFGRRGGRAIAEILNRWNDWKNSIDITKQGIAGTSEEMKKLVEMSASAQFKRFFNAIKAGIVDELSPALKILATALSLMNDELELTDFEKMLKSARKDVENLITMMGRDGNSTLRSMIRTGRDYGNEWAYNIASTKNWIKQLRDYGKITEEIADTMETRIVGALETMVRGGRTPFNLDELRKFFNDNRQQIVKYHSILKDAKEESTALEPVNYALIQSFKALRKETELNNLQMLGLSEAQLSSRKIGSMLSSLYGDLSDSVVNYNKNLEEGEKALTLPSYDNFADKITDISMAFRRSPEAGAKAFEGFREELGKASLPLSAISDILKEVAKQPLQQSIENWKQATDEYNRSLEELKNNYAVQESILKAMGASSENLARNNIAAIEAEINLVRERNEAYLKQPQLSGLSSTEKSNLPEAKKNAEDLNRLQRQLSKANIDLQISAYKTLQDTQDEYFKDIQNNYEIIYKRREADLQLEGAGEEKIIALEKEKLAVQMDYVSNRLVLLSLFDPFNESLRKELESQLKSLGLSKEEIDIKRKLAENEKAIADEQDAINRKQSIYNSLGYTGVDTARMMLDYLKEQNVIKGETLDKLREEYQLQLLSSQLEERGTMLQNDLSVKEEMVSGWSDISAFLGAVKREEMLNEELEIARELGDMKRENLLLDKLKYIEYDKQKALLQDMRGIFSGIGDSIYDLMTGSKSLSDIWQEFNQIVLKKCLETIVEMIMQTQFWSTIMQAMGLGSLFGGGGSAGGGGYIMLGNTGISSSYGKGGIVSAAGGAILPSSPSAIPVLAHPKEMVLPSDISDFIVRSAKTASGQSQKESKPITIVNMIQDDSIAASVARRQDVVLNIVGSDLSRNGITRRTIYRSL